MVVPAPVTLIVLFVPDIERLLVELVVTFVVWPVPDRLIVWAVLVTWTPRRQNSIQQNAK